MYNIVYYISIVVSILYIREVIDFNTFVICILIVLATYLIYGKLINIHDKLDTCSKHGHTHTYSDLRKDQ